MKNDTDFPDQYYRQEVFACHLLRYAGLEKYTDWARKKSLR